NKPANPAAIPIMIRVLAYFSSRSHFPKRLAMVAPN
ncbi:hypothetical protein A5876_003109, partial [Enterococcus sp. 3C8_DIV0646]